MSGLEQQLGKPGSNGSHLSSSPSNAAASNGNGNVVSNGSHSSSSPSNASHSSSSPSNAAASNGNGNEKKLLSTDSIINLNQGDPTVFEEYWKKTGDKAKIVIEGWQCMSYFPDETAEKRSSRNHDLHVCWFMLAEFEEEVRRLHRVVGNAVTENRYIVLGCGSMQLFQAALYAYTLSFPMDAPDSPHPISVVCAAPSYSSYPPVTDLVKSGLYQWAGDANRFQAKANEPYIEIVTTPNNPDGTTREAVVINSQGKGTGKGMLIYDLAYYWPHYTAITGPLDHDIMLFTASKATGHAGSRIGWAVVKDREVAMKMTKFVELSSIGVSKDSQLRTAKILRTISESCQPKHSDHLENGAAAEVENFFRYGRKVMTERWSRLRKEVNLFSLPEFPKQYCNFTGEFTESHPGFAWLKAKEGEGIEDSEIFLKKHNILTRGGKSFGVDSRYVRVSVLDREETFNVFLERLSTINSSSKKGESNGNISSNGQ